MTITRIQRGMIADGAVVVPGNLYTTGTASSSTYLRGDGVWSRVELYDQMLDTTSSVVFANLTVTNSLNVSNLSVNGFTITNHVTWDNIDNKVGDNGPVNIALGKNSNSTIYGPIGSNVISIGQRSNTPGNNSISIGNDVGGDANPGSGGPGTNAIAIGNNIALDSRIGNYSTAIGNNFGYVEGIGNFAVTIGNFPPGTTSRFNNYSVFVGNMPTLEDQDGMGWPHLEGDSVSTDELRIQAKVGGATLRISNGAYAGFYVRPIRQDTSTSATTYSTFFNPFTNEITYSQVDDRGIL